MQSTKGPLLLVLCCAVFAAVAVTYVSRTPDAQAAPAAQAAPQAAPAPAAPQAAPGQEPPKQDLETSTKPNPKLLVEPVDEPDMPLDLKAGKKFDYVPLHNSGGFVFERPTADGKKKVGGVVVPGTILVTRGLVELFGCGEGGKEHETVLRLECDVQSLDMALTLAGYTRGRLPSKLDLDEKGQGSRLVVLVQWVNKDGRVVTHRSEDLVISARRGKPMPRVGWTYVAQWSEVSDPSNANRKNKILSAAGTRSFVTTFRDRTALLDNPLEDALDDTQFAANYMVLPESGTPVRVIFRGPMDDERAQILALEKELAKEPRPVRVPHDHKDDEKEEKK